MSWFLAYITWLPHPNNPCAILTPCCPMILPTSASGPNTAGGICTREETCSVKIRQSRVHVLQAYWSIAQELNSHAKVLAKMSLRPTNLADDFSTDRLEPLNLLKRKFGEGEGPVAQICSLLSTTMEPAQALEEAYELFFQWAQQMAPAMPECVRDMMYA